MAITAGNRRYESAGDLPDEVPVFPLSGALLLPSGQMPLNIFEPRYLAMVDAALAGERLIAMVQPRLDGSGRRAVPDLCDTGCLGRLIQFSETGDGRYLVTLAGITRFRILGEVETEAPFRSCRVSPDTFADIEEPRRGEEGVDRQALLRAFRAYLEANKLEADWESVDRASNAGLVTALSMMSPWGPAEKQALLEAPDHAARASMLIAITEFALASGDGEARLQ